MQEKIMLGDFIYRLRKEKGMSQAELGDVVGVSNKAVSKWETGEANPEISLIKPLADALGVTTDELLACEKSASPTEPTLEAKPQKGFMERVGSGEYVSRTKTANGTPLIHICLNGKKTAKGIVAIGLRAKGLVSVGLLSMGLVSLGLVSVGILSVGLLCIGLIATGLIALGGIAVGGVAIGVLAVGGLSIGFMSVGGLSIGQYAYTGEGGYAIGTYTYITIDGKTVPHVFPPLNSGLHLLSNSIFR